jgi:hypothetical protein
MSAIERATAEMDNLVYDQAHRRIARNTALLDNAKFKSEFYDADHVLVKQISTDLRVIAKIKVE